MTNYNERLDEILRNTYQGIVKRAVEQHSRTIVEFAERNRVVRDQAKQALTSLIKELVTEAKPDRQPPMKMGNPTKESSDLDKMIFAKKKGHNEAINQYEQNLLKALEEA